MHTPLIDAATLQAHLHDADWLIADCRFDLANPSAGAAAYAQGHIPGAIYFHLDTDLSARKDAGAINGGRHPLPSRETACARFAQRGIEPATQVVAYDASGGMYAARLWWMLRWIGHERVAVLDGGIGAWQAAGGALDARPAERAAVDLPLRPARVALANCDDVLRNLQTRTRVVLDARAPDRYDGSKETIDPVGGHIPDALNLPFAANLTPQGKFRTPVELRARFADALGGKPAIHQCGSGVTACHNLLAMTHAGLDAGALYAGSWSEWIEDRSRPCWTPVGSAA